MNDILLSVSHLTKRYRRVEALSDITFDVTRGECVGLLGPNGAGKTTLMTCAVGARVPTTGTVRIAGEDPRHLHDAGRHVAFVFDPAGLSTDFSAGDCIRWEASAQGISRKVAETIIDDHGIRPFARRAVSRLSTGQRQRVALACALLGKPELLILDEPMNGLDVEANRWLRDMITARSEAGLTTVVSSHLLNEVRRVASRVVVIKQTLRYDGPVPELSDDALDSWYLDTVGELGEKVLAHAC